MPGRTRQPAEKCWLQRPKPAPRDDHTDKDRANGDQRRLTDHAGVTQHRPKPGFGQYHDLRQRRSLKPPTVHLALALARFFA